MSFLESAKQYTGSDLETIFFRPILSGDSARELGVRVLYNMPVPTTIQLWDGQRNVLQKYSAAGWTGGNAATKLQKTISLGRVKAELGFSAADYFSLVYEKIAARADVNMDDLTGTELEQAETALFKQAVAESIRATMWVGDTSAASGYNTFDGFLKTVKAGAMQEKFYNSICQAEDFSDPEKVVAVLDDLWMNADERVKDMKADGQLAFFVTSDIYYAFEKYLDGKSADAAYMATTEGRPSLAYHGIPLVDVRLGSYLGSTSLHKSFCLLTDRRNLVLAVNTSDFPRQRSAHVVQPRPDGKPPACRLHGRVRRARRDADDLRLQPGITMADSTPRKPAGGVAAVTVTPAGNLLRAAVAADGRAEAIFRDATQLTALPLAEQRSSYAERLDTDAGPQRMRHTLTLVVGRETFRKAFTPALRRAAETEGLIALVTMASGERLLAGWSARFGTSQPLRPDSFAMESGIKPLDGTPAVLTLTSEDTDPAAELKEQEA